MRWQNKNCCLIQNILSSLNEIGRGETQQSCQSLFENTGTLTYNLPISLADQTLLNWQCWAAPWKLEVQIISRRPLSRLRLPEAVFFLFLILLISLQFRLLLGMFWSPDLLQNKRSSLSRCCRHGGSCLKEKRLCTARLQNNIIFCLLLRSGEFTAHSNLIRYRLWLLFVI